MKKSATIDRILTAAAQEICLKGIDGARIEAIAKEAGVTKQLVYHYFKTKDQLYVAILESVAQGIRLLKDVEVYQELSPADALCKMADTIIDGFARNPSYAVLTLDQALHDGEHISDSSDFIPTFKRFIRDVLTPVLKRGVGDGVFRPDLDPDLTFWLIFNLSASCFLNEKIMSEVSGTDFRSEEGIELWRRTSTQFILNALRP